MKSYPTEKTALILVDPFNDFLSEGGKLYPYTKETVEGVGLVKKLNQLLNAARSKKMLVVYAPHRNTQKGDYLNWKFKSPSHLGSESTTLFEKNSWGVAWVANSMSFDWASAGAIPARRLQKITAARNKCVSFATTENLPASRPR